MAKPFANTNDLIKRLEDLLHATDGGQVVSRKDLRKLIDEAKAPQEARPAPKTFAEAKAAILADSELMADFPEPELMTHGAPFATEGVKS